MGSWDEIITDFLKRLVDRFEIAQLKGPPSIYRIGMEDPEGRINFLVRFWNYGAKISERSDIPYLSA